MPFALPDVCGFAPATFRGQPIPEKDLAQGGLGSVDTHFGINGDVSSLVNDGSIAGYGPRAVDIKYRGGIVAESLWEEFQANPNGPYSAGLEKFLLFFDDLGSTKPQSSNAYKPGAKISGDSVAGHEKYLAGTTDKSMASISDANQKGTDYQLGTRWSKVALEMTFRKGGRIHFHLDGMGNVGEVVDKVGDYNANVTSRELRYVRRNWHRKDFRESVTFYNGYSKTGSGAYKAVIVAPPWG